MDCDDIVPLTKVILALSMNIPITQSVLRFLINGLFKKIQDSIDVQAAMKKLENQRRKLQAKLSSLLSAIEGTDYSEKVPLKVQEANRQKVKVSVHGQLRALSISSV